MSPELGPNAKCTMSANLLAIGAKDGVSGHRVWSMLESYEAEPLIEVVGHGSEASRPGFARLRERSFFPAHGITASKIYMQRSTPPCTRKSEVPRGIFRTLASWTGAPSIDRPDG